MDYKIAFLPESKTDEKIVMTARVHSGKISKQKFKIFNLLTSSSCNIFIN